MKRDIKTLSDIELDAEMQENVREDNMIADELGKAKANRQTSGKSRGVHWFQQTEQELKALRRRMELLKMERAERRRREYATSNNTLDCAFRLVAKRDLEMVDYEEIMSEARAIARGEKPWPDGTFRSTETGANINAN